MTPFQISEGIYVAAIFTAKVTHWKNCNLYESFIFILVRKGRCVGWAGLRAVRRDLLSALTVNEALCFLSHWPAMSLTSGMHVPLSALCAQRVCSSYFFWPWIPRSTDRASTLENSVLEQFRMRFLSGKELTPPWDLPPTPHAFIQAYSF